MHPNYITIFPEHKAYNILMFGVTNAPSCNITTFGHYATCNTNSAATQDLYSSLGNTNTSCETVATQAVTVR